MRELSDLIKQILSVTSVTDLATDGIHPLIGTMEDKEFVTYKLRAESVATKDGRQEWILDISCYSGSYTDACAMHDQVEAVLRANKIYLTAADAGYLVENSRCVVSSSYQFKTK